MPLPTKTYEQYLSDIISTWAGILFLNPNLQSGDPLLALFQALVLGGFMFQQAQIIAVNKLTRAATSTGADLDSWMADFSFPRKPAAFATGQVQFSVNRVLSSNVSVPVGTVIQTLDGSIQYQVIADTNQSAYQSQLNAYVLPAGQLMINATVQAVTAGSASNVQVGALSQLVSAVTGINNVTNLADIMNGADPESDPAYRLRFQLMINSVNGKATLGGVYSAAIDVPGVQAVKIIEGYDQYNYPRVGYGTIVIDDGSGSPPSSLLDTVFKAVFPVRGFTAGFVVIGPTKVNITIQLNIRINPNATDPSQITKNVEFAVIDYINSLEIGDTLYLENVSQVAKDADSNVIAVEAGSTKINDAQADLVPTNHGVIRTDNTMVTIGSF